MSERLEKLAAELNSLPKSSDIMQQAPVTLLMAQGTMLAHLPKVEGDVSQRMQILATSNDTLDKMADMLGEEHKGIIIMRKMMAIATAVVKGEPEPTDDELKKFDKSGACFIATAACGTSDVPDVVRLREFRDTVLRRTSCGRALIRVYESLSPPVAEVVARSVRARALVRRLVVRPARRLADFALRGRQGRRGRFLP